MPTVRFTRGRLTATWLVLRTLEKIGGQAEASEVMSYARRSSLRGGGLPLQDGARLAREGGFVVERAGIYALQPLGQRALELGSEDEPSHQVLRLFVTVLLLRDPPTWVAWWQGAPHDLDAVIPEGERIVLREAGLLPVPPATDPAGWGWWQALGRVPLPEHTAIERKQIGDAGESLSVRYERWRLTEQGYVDLASRVAWLAQESDAYGFDVLSFAGDDHPPLAPDTPMAIEVKSTALPGGPFFRCFLTAHEWETALGLAERHVLHFWQGVDAGPPPSSRNERPIVMPASLLTDHLPGASACGDACGWQSARVEIPVA
jgi:hypothetical protein